MVEVLKYKGQFDVELEVPLGSGLTDADIKRVLRIASWEGDVNGLVKEFNGHFEGNRSVVLPREIPYRNPQGIEIKALQVSGVGYFTSTTNGFAFVLEKEARFKPPSAANFMDGLSPEAMRTSRAVGDVFVVDRDSYKPTGPYTQSSLKRKVEGTSVANGLELKLMAVPRVEAVGKYMNLEHDGEPLGFLVLSAPDKPRLSEDVNRMFERICENESISRINAVGLYVMTFGLVLPRLAIGLRELHEKGKVHRQPHAANLCYFKDNDQIMLMDWDTVQSDNSDKSENLTRRVIDIMIAHNIYDKMYRVIFNNDDMHKELAGVSGKILSMILYAYAGNAPEFFTFFESMPDGRDDAVVRQWLEYMQKIPVRHAKEFDVDSFADGWNAMMKRIVSHGALKSAPLSSAKKTGRNESCPCGSGRKFKKCCGA